MLDLNQFALKLFIAPRTLSRTVAHIELLADLKSVAYCTLQNVSIGNMFGTVSIVISHLCITMIVIQYILFSLMFLFSI